MSLITYEPKTKTLILKDLNIKLKDELPNDIISLDISDNGYNRKIEITKSNLKNGYKYNLRIAYSDNENYDDIWLYKGVDTFTGKDLLSYLVKLFKKNYQDKNYYIHCKRSDEN